MTEFTSVKWIVIGVVAIAFLIIFRDEVSQLLGRIESVTIGSKGVTLETPLGTTDVTVQQSQPTAYGTTYPPERFVTYISNEHSYAISYPRHSVWVELAAFGAYWEQKIESVEGYSNAIIAPGEGDFAAMVIVRVYPSGNLGIREAIPAFQRQAGQGVSYETPRFDLATNSATLVGFDRIGNKISIIRVLIVRGFMYELRAAFSPDVSSRIKREMNEIVNSFQMLL